MKLNERTRTAVLVAIGVPLARLLGSPSVLAFNAFAKKLHPGCRSYKSMLATLETRAGCTQPVAAPVPSSSPATEHQAMKTYNALCRLLIAAPLAGCALFPAAPAHAYNHARDSLPSTCEHGLGQPLPPTTPMANARYSAKYQNDENNLPYYGYRYYNASTGKWLSRDPSESRGDPNLNAFVANDPVGNYDFLGLWIRSGYEKSWGQMHSMLSRSKECFRQKLYALCPPSTSISCGGNQVCTTAACHLQADVLSLDFASYLEATFTSQYNRFGNVLAFTPLWLPRETINDRANKAPNKGMIWIDYYQGFGLKCYGMQDLMTRRFDAIMRPLARAGMQCFKGAKVGNRRDSGRASHHWFAIYALSNNDLSKVDVHVDPWFSAGGIISPDRREFGEAKYFDPIIWW